MLQVTNEYVPQNKHRLFGCFVSDKNRRHSFFDSSARSPERLALAALRRRHRRCLKTYPANHRSTRRYRCCSNRNPARSMSRDNFF
jgi:hypothetical protein